MSRKVAAPLLLTVVSFLAGFFSHALYSRWTAPPRERTYPVSYAPAAPATAPAEIPLVSARDVDKLKALAGRRARVRGTVYRVGYSAKSNTHFLNFGPSRSAFTGVIFASAVEAFEKKQLQPKSYEGKEVELAGMIKDHPQYGLEMVLEDPSQVRVLD